MGVVLGGAHATGELNLYTGTLRYKDIDFTFTFDKVELRLIPPEDKRHIVEWEWKMKPIKNGVYTFSDPMPVEESYLIGICNETKHKIIFVPQKGSKLFLYNSIVGIELVAYVICKYDREMIDRMEITCPEINYIHPVNQAFGLVIDPEDYAEKGLVTLRTQNFDATTTEKQTFIVDEKEVRSYFAISRTVSMKCTQCQGQF